MLARSETAAMAALVSSAARVSSSGSRPISRISPATVLRSLPVLYRTKMFVDFFAELFGS
jgi:hypothetical protein